MAYFNDRIGKHAQEPGWEYSPEANRRNAELFKKLTTSEIINKFMPTIKNYFSNVSLLSSGMKYSYHNIEFAARYYPTNLGKQFGKKIFFPIRIYVRVENCNNPDPYNYGVQFRTTIEFYVYCLERGKGTFDSYKNHLAIQEMTKYFSFRSKALGISFDNWSTPTYITNTPSKNRCVILESLFDLYNDYFGPANLIDIDCMTFQAILNRIDEYNEGEMRDNLANAIKTGALYWIDK